MTLSSSFYSLFQVQNIIVQQQEMSMGLLKVSSC